MATDGKTPPPCDPEIFQKGQPVAALDGSSNAVERWVKAVAKKAHARVDWHYSGGVAQVLYLGDTQSRARVMDAMRKLAPQLQGRIRRYFTDDDTGLYRKGITVTPPGAIASIYDGGARSSFIVGSNQSKKVSIQKRKGSKR